MARALETQALTLLLGALKPNRWAFRADRACIVYFPNQLSNWRGPSRPWALTPTLMDTATRAGRGLLAPACLGAVELLPFLYLLLLVKYVRRPPWPRLLPAKTPPLTSLDPCIEAHGR